jgi:3-isopropylmalate dehydrogenase
MQKHILILPGDGIGQEVTQEGKKILEAIATKFHHQFTFDQALIGHEAIEKTGNPLPDETLQI